MADKADKATVVEEPQQEVVEDSPSSKEPQVQEQTDVSENEQAKAFAQMRQEIKELKTQLVEAKKINTSPKVDQTFTPAPTYVDVNQFIDPTTGEFNASAYNQAVNTTIANQTVYSQQVINQEVDFAQAQIIYPSLDSTSDQYDPDFAEEVAARHFYQTSLGKEVSVKQIAREVAARRAKEVKKETAKIEAEMAEVNTQKEIASLETSSQSASAARAAQTRMEEEADVEELRYRTRGLKGDAFSGQRYSEQEQLNATVERLKNIPVIVEETTGT